VKIFVFGLEPVGHAASLVERTESSRSRNSVRSGNKLSVAQTFNDMMSSVPNPDRNPGTRGTNPGSGRRAPLGRRPVRADDLLDQVGARGGVEQRLRARRHAVRLRVEQQVADGFAQLGAAGLSGHEHHVAPLTQRRGEEIHLRRLAAAVQAFKADEKALYRCPGPVTSRR